MENLSLLQYAYMGLWFAIGGLVALALNSLFTKKNKAHKKIKSVEPISRRKVKTPPVKLDVPVTLESKDSPIGSEQLPVMDKGRNKNAEPHHEKRKYGEYKNIYNTLDIGGFVYYKDYQKALGLYQYAKRNGGIVGTESVIRYGKKATKCTKIK